MAGMREGSATYATRNMRNVWTMATQPFQAPTSPRFRRRCIKAACPLGGRVLDPFGGSGTTGLVADRLKRNATLIDLNRDYVEMARNRIEIDAPLFAKIEHAAATGRAIRVRC
jgi:hypothetical protein